MRAVYTACPSRTARADICAPRGTLCVCQFGISCVQSTRLHVVVIALAELYPYLLRPREKQLRFELALCRRGEQEIEYLFFLARMHQLLWNNQRRTRHIRPSVAAGTASVNHPAADCRRRCAGTGTRSAHKRRGIA